MVVAHDSSQSQPLRENDQVVSWTKQIQYKIWPSLTFKAHVIANFVVDFNGKPYFSEDNDIIGNIDIICGHIITHTPPRIKVCLNP